MIRTSNKKLMMWTGVFLKQRDLMRKEIISMTLKEDDNEIIIKKKNGVEKVIVINYISRLNNNLNNIINNGFSTIVTLNNNDNLKEIINYWQELVKKDDLKIIFVNPDNNDKWIIKPAVHNKIADKKTLREGLRSMLNNVGEVS